MKELIKSSSIYVLLGFLPMGVNFLLTPLYSHLLLPEENALIGQSVIFQSFLGVLLNLSIDSAFSRFYFDYYKDEPVLKRYMSTVVSFIVILSAAVFAVFLFTGDSIFSFFQKNNTFSFHKYGIWVLLTTFCIVIQTIFLAYYRNAQKPFLFALVSLSFFFAGIALMLTGMIVFKAGALGSIAGRAIAYAAVTLVLLIVFYRHNKFDIDKKFLKESLRYSVPIIPYVILMNLYGNIDRILIERYFTLKELGVYNFAFLISGTVSVFVSSFQNAVGPVVYKVLADEEPGYEGKVNSLFRGFHFINIAIMTLGLAAAVPFVKLFIAVEYHLILQYIGILFFAFIFRIYYLLYVDSLFFYKKTKWISIITFTSFVIGLSTNLVLIPLLGITGVCLSVLVINLVQAFGAFLQLKMYRLNLKIYKLPFNHLYAVAVLLAYFIPLVLTRQQGNLSNVYNYLPLMVTIVFSILFYMNNKDQLKIGSYVKSWLKVK